MAEEFDPAWEYFVPDPEVHEPPPRVRGIPLDVNFADNRGITLFGSGRPAGRPPAVRDPGLFARMWASGYTLAEMAVVFSITDESVQRVRRRLGLPPRPPGNHSTTRDRKAV